MAMTRAPQQAEPNCKVFVTGGGSYLLIQPWRPDTGLLSNRPDPGELHDKQPQKGILTMKKARPRSVVR